MVCFKINCATVWQWWHCRRVRYQNLFYQLIKWCFECWPKAYIPQSKLIPSDKMAIEEKSIFFTFCKMLYFVLCKKCTCSVWEADHCTCKLCKEQKILQKSGLHEAPPKQEFEENCGIFSALDYPPPLLFGWYQLTPYLETTSIVYLWRA